MITSVEQEEHDRVEDEEEQKCVEDTDATLDAISYDVEDTVDEDDYMDGEEHDDEGAAIIL